MTSQRVIFTSPHLIENIFKFLGPRDLSSCAQVCSLWYNLSLTEKSRRNKIACFFKVGPCEEHELSCVSYKLCASCSHDEMESALDKDLESIRMQPAFCFTFLSTHLFENFQDFFPSFVPFEPEEKKGKYIDKTEKRQYLNSVIKTSIKPHLPMNCSSIFIVAPGVIGTNKDLLPREIEDGIAISGCLIPHLPGVEVHHLTVQGRNPNLSSFIAEKAPVKCVLIFLTCRGASLANKLVASFNSNPTQSNMAIGGAIVKRTESLLGTVVAFSGENVEAASVIINPRDKKDELVAKLKVFGKTGLLENPCIAYMFACICKGFRFYRKYNLESSTFHQMYPQVPLIGVYGNGEIGVNYFPNMEAKNSDLSCGVFKQIRKYLFGYTTVFVLVSFKK